MESVPARFRLMALSVMIGRVKVTDPMMRFVSIGVLLPVVGLALVACEDRERKGPGSDPLESKWTHHDLKGLWRTEVNGLAAKVLIDFGRGHYSVDVPRAPKVKLRLISDAGGEVVFELSALDGSATERIRCVFTDRNAISMYGGNDVPQVFRRIEGGR